MQNSEIKRGVLLKVPFDEKDDAKKLGARWDPDFRQWFVPQGMDTKPFRRWLQDEKTGASR
ncbi:MAG: DUF5710 domain-containing protein [Bdellovibrionota bacterium]